MITILDFKLDDSIKVSETGIFSSSNFIKSTETEKIKKKVDEKDKFEIDEFNYKRIEMKIIDD